MHARGDGVNRPPTCYNSVMINHKDCPIESMKLCYIDERYKFAWFTSVELELQWGDDWNDAPYEHNAGEPYDTHKEGTERVEHHLLKVAWDGPYNTPASLAYRGNSHFSVQSINRGVVAWLEPENIEEHEQIYNGISLPNFISKIERAGGNVYIPSIIAKKIMKVCKQRKV
jgi:hypothetical protein